MLWYLPSVEKGEEMIGSYLIDKVTLRMDKGSDQWQEPNTPEDITVRAFIEYKERRIENAEGEVVVSMSKVSMRPRTVITSGFSTRAAKTISYKDTLIFDGIIHSIIKLGKSRDFSVRSTDVYVA